MSKIITAQQAAELVFDGAVIAAATIGLSGWPQEVALAIGERFLKTGHPGKITLMHSCACGDHQDNRNGSSSIAYDGLVTRLICAHTSSAMYMVNLVAEEKAECYLLPQGIFPQMYRSVSGNKPGVITKVGLHTFVDPRIEGAKANSITTDDIIELMEIDGEEWLRYKNLVPDIALLRCTCCDEKGNMTMDEEIVFMEQLSLASAVKNRGGTVICQVKNIAAADSLHPKRVKIPAALIDYIVVATKPEYHMQTQQTLYSPAFSGDMRVPITELPRTPLDARKVINRRAAMELRKGAMVNLGKGVPEGVAHIVAEEGLAGSIILTTELGGYGGVPAGGLDFAATYNAEAILDHGSMFDLYDGGGLDIAFLGTAQVDRYGNVNVSKLGKNPIGPGGFINISQNTHHIVFCSTFTSGAKIRIAEGKLEIVQEGKNNKFVNDLMQITFSSKYAEQTGQFVLFVTERCVFRLNNQKLALTEVAPGIDMQTQVLDLLPFSPEISPDLKSMDAALFNETWGGLSGIINA